MYIKTTYIGTLDGNKGMWCGFLPEGVEVEEERQVLYPEQGYSLKKISTEQIFSSVWLKGKDKKENYIEVEKQADTEEEAYLHLTRGDVFRGIYQAKGITREEVRALIEAMPDDTKEEADLKELASIDFDEALYFYRGNELISKLGKQLGISENALTRFFVTNDWHSLL